MIELIYTGEYFHEQIFRQVTPCCFLGLQVSGLEKDEIYTPTGELVGEAQNLTLVLIPEKFTLDFAFNHHRENYVSVCRIPGLKWNSYAKQLELQLKGQKFLLPLIVNITHQQLPFLREIFQRAVKLTRSTLETDKLIAEMLMEYVLAEFIANAQNNTRQHIPAAIRNLKEKLDQDQNFQCSIVELLAHSAASPSQMRRNFERFYHMTPGEYQAKLRFLKISALLHDKTLGLKEIADQVGMKNVTHLHSFVKKYCQMTPNQLRKSFVD